MDNQERHKRPLKLLAQHRAATVPELVGWLGVSPATIRRDIRLLAVSGQIKRISGGGQPVDGPRVPALSGASAQSGAGRHPERKRAIARFAASMCRDGESVVIGGGSTMAGMAGFFNERSLRVVANSCAVARIVLESSDNDVILSGGRISPEQSIILFPFDSAAIQHCYADQLLIGMHSLTMLGVMETDPLLIQTGRRLMGQAQQVVVLADSSKFGNKGGLFLCVLEKASCVVMDDAAPHAVVPMLERAGIVVDRVAPDSFYGLSDSPGLAHRLGRGAPATKPPH